VTNLLAPGLPLTGKRRLARRLFATGDAAAESLLVVTTTEAIDRIVDGHPMVRKRF
jgi:hypothetical protein